MALNCSLTLPEPDADEQEHSQKLMEKIRAAIRASNAFLPFERYMRMALYEPALGYYVAGARKFGAEGDFITAPEVSPLFSQCLARQCAEVLETFERPACVLELGAGSGIMAADMLAELERLDALPDHYYILELSGELQQRQRETLESRVPHLARSVKWLESLPPSGFHGVVVANEVLDAMPVCLFDKARDGFREWGVAIEGDGLAFQQRPVNDHQQRVIAELEREARSEWPVGYRSEWNPQLKGWLQALADSLTQAAIFLVDYGYPRSEYYHEQRREGTLLCFYRHRANEQPLSYPGLQDITASVDFTAVADAGVQAGLDLAGVTTQAYFLMNSGLESLVAAAMDSDTKAQLRVSQQVKQLTLPSEMGERFQVIGFTKGLDLPLRGFSRFDLTHKL